MPCTLCGAEGVNSRTCPFNRHSISPQPERHNPDLVEQFRDADVPIFQDHDTGKLVNARDIKHGPDSPFITGYIDGPMVWNLLGFSQLDPIPPTLTNTWVKEIPDGPTLFDYATHTLRGHPDSIVVFHGSTMKHKDDLDRFINWSLGGGTLGDGFYFTLNPNEAKGYACTKAAAETYRRVKPSLKYPKEERGHLSGRRHDDYAIVLECVIENASKLAVDRDFVQHHCSRRQCQFVGYQQLVNQLDILRVHIMRIDQFVHPGSPGRVSDSKNSTLCKDTVRKYIQEKEQMVKLKAHHANLSRQLRGIR